VEPAGVSRLNVNPESRPAAAFAAGGFVLIGIYFVFPAGGTAQSVIYDTLGVLSVLATLWAVRHYRPETPLPWILFALGNLCFVVGDIITDVWPNLSSPSASDAFYLAGYPLVAAGLILLFVHAGGHHRRAAVAEAAIATFAFALIQWTFVMHPALTGNGSYASRLVAATYPAGDVVLLAGFAGFLVSPAWRKPAFWLLLAAVASLLIGDEINGLANSYSAGSGLDATWMLSYVLFGAAALHPSMRELAEPRRAARLRVSTWRIGLLTAAVPSEPEGLRMLPGLGVTGAVLGEELRVIGPTTPPPAGAEPAPGVPGMPGMPGRGSGVGMPGVCAQRLRVNSKAETVSNEVFKWLIWQ
jgi:diguanylate cyclase